MVEQSTKRKKHHDKDKYYRLAKEQGLRSRAAFKLVQINRKFHVLEQAKVVLDLCAAPGGWTQIASRTMAQHGVGGGRKGGNKEGTTSGSIIVAVDILPIRYIGPNVITLVGDITTQECHTKIKQTLSGSKVDVVLSDGAPNVGANYDRDAYAQNEIALLSLKCATNHLRPNGTFITKLYRSRDYNAYLWAVRQFFREVKAVKPVSSRSQSAEIFIVCLGYKAPDKIDPKLLDPKAVFDQEGIDEHGDDDVGISSNKKKKVTIFHKNYEATQKGRKRQGYDLSTVDATMRNTKTVVDFINSPDPIQMLTDCTGLVFTEECQPFFSHPFTTLDIKECIADFKVLNKGDFKNILSWRLKMQQFRDEGATGNEEQQQKRDDNDLDESSSDKSVNEMEEEEKIQEEIRLLSEKRLRDKKREKKKEREIALKRRRRAALGMNLNSTDLPEHDQVFSLATITSKGDLEAIREVDLDTVDKKIMVGEEEDDDDVLENCDPESRKPSVADVHYDEYEDEVDQETGYSFRLERELDESYNRYLANTKSKAAKAGTRMEKAQKLSKKKIMAKEATQDEEMLIASSAIDEETKRYAQILQGGKDSDEESNSTDSDADSAVGEAFQDNNPLIYEPPEPKESVSAKTARWFSNPLFETIGIAAHAASSGDKKEKKLSLEELTSLASDDDGEESLDDEDLVSASDDNDDSEKVTKPRLHSKRKAGLDVEEILANWPKTEKQTRHEKRLKAMERKERKEAKRSKLNDEGFEVVSEPKQLLGGTAEKKMSTMSDSQKKKALQAMELIKAGMGLQHPGRSDSVDPPGFDVVPAVHVDLPVMDTRKYDSENEDYDSDDHARTLALGTMMLRRSKEKALVDASYNRFAWNDPEDLPDWFLDDEHRHHRPQIPIPAALIEKIKARFVALSTKPIKKVAEARARKSKRAKQKLAAAKKKAEAVANNPDMSEATKLKAISKAMRGQEMARPGKTYVVAKRGLTKGGKGIKLVDSRMKSDKRSMERTMKKKKFGKKGGLTGTKRRRNHK
jgi:AdoMet-dependent rRNA methyltransferase SPB1